MSLRSVFLALAGISLLAGAMSFAGAFLLAAAFAN